ncbi:MAG: Lrp/AsnC family transcriptional regulator [Candidatus Nanoarchaeia archaeon]
MKVIKLEAQQHSPDKRDMKILNLLMENARTSYSAIAKKLKISHDSVNYRIKNLEGEGVISGYRTVVNSTFFGLYPYHIFVRLPPKYHKELVSRCMKSPFVRTIIRLYGSYDFQIAILGRDSKDLDDRAEYIFSGMSNVKIEILITADYITRKGLMPYFEEPTMKRNHHVFDETDKKIMAEICENPRTPLLSVSQKIGVSVDTVIKRLKEMEKCKVIMSYIPIINHYALGKSVFIVVAYIDDLKAQTGKIKEFSRQHESLFWAARTVGRYNLIMYFSVKDSLEFHKEFTELRALLGEKVWIYELLSGYEQYKLTYFSRGLVEEQK